MRKAISRRDVLKASAALAAGAVFASPARAAAPAPVAITPELVAAAPLEDNPLAGGLVLAAILFTMGVLGIFSFRMSSSTLSWVSRQVKMAVRTRGSSTS